MRACRNMKPLFYVVKGDVWLLFYVHKAVRQRERKGEREREKKRWTLGFPASKKKKKTCLSFSLENGGATGLAYWKTNKQTSRNRNIPLHSV